MKRAISVLAAVAAGAIAWPTSTFAQNFCTDFFAVYDARIGGFASLRGAYDRESEKWISVRDLPGASSCTITDWGYSADFHCTWEVPGDLAETNRVAQELVMGMRGCLGARGVSYGPLVPTPPGGAFDDNWGVNQRGENVSIRTMARLSRGRGTVFLTIIKRGLQ